MDGYWLLVNNGILLNFGKDGIQGSGSDIIFPLAYFQEVIPIICRRASAVNNYSVLIKSSTITGFTAVYTNNSSSTGSNWLAIGY